MGEKAKSPLEQVVPLHDYSFVQYICAGNAPECLRLLHLGVVINAPVVGGFCNNGVGGSFTYSTISLISMTSKGSPNISNTC